MFFYSDCYYSMDSFIYWSQLWVKTLHFQCNTLVMRKNRVSSANLSNLPALRHGLAKEDFQSERKTPVLSVQGGLVLPLDIKGQAISLLMM